MWCSMYNYVCVCGGGAHCFDQYAYVFLCVNYEINPEKESMKRESSWGISSMLEIKPDDLKRRNAGENDGNTSHLNARMGF